MNTQISFSQILAASPNRGLTIARLAAQYGRDTSDFARDLAARRQAKRETIKAAWRREVEDVADQWWNR